MTGSQDILARFTDQGPDNPLYLADLTMWHAWHRAQGSLPPEWRAYTLPQVARALGSPVWWTARPWRVEMPGIVVTTQEKSGERVIQYQTPAGVLSERWKLGPDGDWWQMEYPAKSSRDLAAVRHMVEARTYTVDARRWDHWQAMAGDDGILAVEIPQCPYSNLLHTILGWGEGLMMLLGEERTQVLEILEILEQKQQHIVQEIVHQVPGAMVLAPDNLDGQYISPQVFKEHLAPGYRQAAEVVHQADKYLMVHIGGPAKHLMAPLAENGVDGIEGVSGPPQSNASIAEARQAAGPNLTLWGGIAQDYLLEARSQEEFEAAVNQAIQEAEGDGRVILGVADRVPVDAVLDRLRALPNMIQKV